MNSTLALQQKLYRQQKREIDSFISGRTAEFNAYQRSYERRAGKEPSRLLNQGHYLARLAANDVIYVGDYHTLPASQLAFLELVNHLGSTSRRLVLALEIFEGRHQAAVDAYLRGELGEKALAAKTGHSSPHSLLPRFFQVLRLAKQLGLKVLAIDSRSGGAGSLRRRDVFAAQRIAKVLNEADLPRVAVLMGEFHIAPPHLPAQVKAAAGRGFLGLSVYQHAAAPYWALAQRLPTFHAAEITNEELFVPTASPVEAQLSYLEYLDSVGTSPEESSLAVDRFALAGRTLAPWFGMSSKARPLEATVLTEHSHRRALSRLSASERAMLQEQKDAGQSCYLPAQRVVYLATSSMEHVAEEAAHAWRHQVVGDSIIHPRSSAEAFFATAVEEALAYFCSKLLTPHRQSLSVADWARAFETERGFNRKVAAFTLAIHAALQESPTSLRQVRPSGPKLSHAVAHSVGYLLGERLHTDVRAGKLDLIQVRALLTQPLDNPVRALWALAQPGEAAKRRAA